MPNETGNKPVPSHKKHIARQQREQKQTRLILYIFFGILGTVILLLVYGWLDINYLQLNKAIAKIGSTEILVKDFQPRVRLQRENLLSQYVQYQQYAQFFGIDVSTQTQQIQAQLSDTQSIGQAIVNLMVDEEIIRQEAAKRGITASEEEINSALQSALGYFPNGTPTATVTPTEFVLPELPAEVFKILTATLPPTATLEASATPQPTNTEIIATDISSTNSVTATAQPSLTATATSTSPATPTAAGTATASPTATPYTETGFQKNVSELQNNVLKLGFDETYYRKFFEVQILEKKLREEILTNVPATETQVRARHILVADEQTAKDLIARLQAGDDFAELAVQFSTDTASATLGGDLGWFGKNKMVAEFEAAAFALQKSGDITTTPVKTSFGYHIIQLVAKQETPLTAEQFQQAQDVEFRKWLDSMRTEYGVEIFDSVWQQNTPSEPNFITAATESAAAEQTAQA